MSIKPRWPVSQLLAKRQGSAFSTIVVLAFIAVLLADSLLSDVSRIVNQNLPDSTRVALFSAIVGVAILAGSHVIAQGTSRIKDELGAKNNVLRVLSRVMAIVQYVIVVLLVMAVLQMIFSSQYLSFFLISSLALSWLAGATVMGIMSLKFFQWYRANRGKLVLLYLASSLIVCFILVTASIPAFVIMAQASPLSINSQSTPVQPFQANPQDAYTMVVSMANWLVIPLSFILWGATAVMLSRYSKTIGRARYWAMLSAPLASVIIGDVALLFFLPSVNTIFDQEVIFYTMIVFGGMITEGFLLGFAFRTISKNIRNSVQGSLSRYLDISAMGVAILFVCFFANPSAGSYPPFGLVASSFLGFGAYLFFAGIYSSAITISLDLKLRQAIRKSLLDQSRLLDDIALADMNRELEKHTASIVMKQKEILKKETGFDSTVSDFEIRNYMEEVVAELKKEGGKTSQEQIAGEQPVDRKHGKTET